MYRVRIMCRVRGESMVWQESQHASEADALAARDRALDAGHVHVLVDGLPEVVEGFCNLPASAPVDVLPEATELLAVAC